MARQFSPESIRLLSAIAEELSVAASSWAPDVRLVGNVRATDIVMLCDAWLNTVNNHLNNHPKEENLEESNE